MHISHYVKCPVSSTFPLYRLSSHTLNIISILTRLQVNVQKVPKHIFSVLRVSLFSQIAHYNRISSLSLYTNVHIALSKCLKCLPTHFQTISSIPLYPLSHYSNIVSYTRYLTNHNQTLGKPQSAAVLFLNTPSVPLLSLFNYIEYPLYSILTHSQPNFGLMSEM